MPMFLCQGCGYKFRPRGIKSSPPSMCPACGRTGRVVETENLISKFLRESENE